MNEMLWDVGTGFVSGTASGLVLALFFGVSRWLRVRSERRDQTNQISTLIIEYRTTIFDIETDESIRDPRAYTSEDAVRRVYYNELQRHLDAVLLGRSSRLTFDEIQEVRRIFFALLPESDWVPNHEYYVNTFKRAESLKWLNVPPTSQ